MNTRRSTAALSAATRLLQTAAVLAPLTLPACIETDPAASAPVVLAPPSAPPWRTVQPSRSRSERLPVLQQRWPPAGQPAALEAFLWCLPDDQRSPFEQPHYRIELAPTGAGGQLLRGANQAGQWPFCLRLSTARPAPSSPWLRLPSLLRDGDEPIAQLPLTPLTSGLHPSPEQLSCDDNWRQAGLGCVSLDGPLLHIQTPPQWLLWLVRLQAPGAEGTAIEWLSPMHGDSITVGLPEQDVLSLQVETIDLNGQHVQQHITIDRPSWTP